MPGQHGWPRGWRQVLLPFFQKERQEKKSKWCPATPCPPGKEGRWAHRKQTGLHWRHGSAISHPRHGAQRDVGSCPMPKSPVAHPGRQPAGTAWGLGCSQGSRSLLRGPAPRPAGTWLGTRWGCPVEHVFLGWAKDTQNTALGCNRQQFPEERV